MSETLKPVDYNQCKAMCYFVNQCLVDHEKNSQTDPVFFEKENLDRLETRREELNCVVFSSPKRSTS